MQYFRLLISTLCLITSHTATIAQDSIVQKRITGYVSTEVNYGRHEKGTKPLIDFPHLIAGATVQMGRGWSVVTEVEYERFRTDGQWGNNFRDNYTTNKFYVNKSWSQALNVKAGIVDIPVGTTNSGGPALTIYDPLDESTLMPMTWHEGGAALWGSYRKVHYEVGAYVYPTAPLKDSRLLGAAARVGIMPVDGLDLSLSCFYGSSKEGMVQRQNPNLAEFDHVHHTAFDIAYVANGWTIDGQLTASSCHSNKAAGVEIGYDVATLLGWSCCSIIPFTRYDGYYHVEGVSCNKYTVGLNTSLPLGFVIKAETGRTFISDDSCTSSFDLSLGWQCEF